MSSWDNSPWSNFYILHWELICRNKRHPGTLEISTPPEIAAGKNMHNMAVKISQYFYLLMEKLLDCYFQVQSSYYHLPADSTFLFSLTWYISGIFRMKPMTSLLILTCYKPPFWINKPFMILIALILDSLFAPCVSTRHLVIKNPLSQLAFPC